MPKLQMRTQGKGAGRKISYFLNIPKEIISDFKWEKGDTIHAIPNDDGTILLKNSKK